MVEDLCHFPFGLPLENPNGFSIFMIKVNPMLFGLKLVSLVDLKKSQWPIKNRQLPILDLEIIEKKLGI